MRFLADEGCDAAIIDTLREKEHDVLAIAENARSISDREILAWGLREERIILHHDLDFGELIFRDNLPTFGVILMRMDKVDSAQKAERIRAVVDEYGERLIGAITKVTAKRAKISAITADAASERREEIRLMQKESAWEQAEREKFIAPDYVHWRAFAESLDGEALCREKGIRKGWYAQQCREYARTGEWRLSIVELRLILYFEANKSKYNGGIENRARVESLLNALKEAMRKLNHER
jgi:predicted nuclease of predicted toxin-antitoxin system